MIDNLNLKLIINIESQVEKIKKEEKKNIKDLKVKVILDLDLEIEKRRMIKQKNRKSQLKLKIREK